MKHYLWPRKKVYSLVLKAGNMIYVNKGMEYSKIGPQKNKEPKTKRAQGWDLLSKNKA